ncbi:hypothetical protein [Alkalihalobacillus pseudalcaliphilus]|uniref:hypothetical protein n=1 Tax=Alkalihalobacillus pseudalcaliphilus TaxID=79884 RepID=UPI000A69B629|nr:hypothetical protein [Alkalihalobacillus pseudalcaliphilus]
MHKAHETLTEQESWFLNRYLNLRLMKRNVFGYQRFDRFRARILLRHQYKKIGKHVG